MPNREMDFHGIYEDVYGQWSYTTDAPIDPGKTALVIIDAQRAFTDSSIGYMKAYAKTLKVSLAYFENRVHNVALPAIARLLTFYRQHNLRIVYVVTYSATEDLADMDVRWQRTIRKWEALLGEQIWRKWNSGMEVWPEIAPQEHELVVNKRASSAFAASMLPVVLKNAGVETVVLTGFNTNGCVFQTACVGSNMGYDFVVVSDATACFSQTLQDMAETWMARFFGNVCSAEQTIERLQQSM